MAFKSGWAHLCMNNIPELVKQFNVYVHFQIFIAVIFSRGCFCFLHVEGCWLCETVLWLCLGSVGCYVVVKMLHVCVIVFCSPYRWRRLNLKTEQSTCWKES